MDDVYGMGGRSPGIYSALLLIFKKKRCGRYEKIAVGHNSRDGGPQVGALLNSYGPVVYYHFRH